MSASFLWYCSVRSTFYEIFPGTVVIPRIAAEGKKIDSKAALAGAVEAAHAAGSRAVLRMSLRPRTTAGIYARPASATSTMGACG